MTETVSTKTMEELVIEATAEKTISPTTPVDISIAEAVQLHSYAIEDKAPLMGKGLKFNLIEELPVRAKYLQDKQSTWVAVYQSSLTSTQEWEEKINEAILLQRELKYDFQFAYRNSPDILLKLNNIMDGNGNIDLIQDLSDYPKFAKEHPNELRTIKFDYSKLEKANALSHELLDLMAKVDGVKESKNRPEKIMRDKAYTYLKQLVDEIRAYGKYAFWNDEEKQKRYASEYGRKKHAKK